MKGHCKAVFEMALLLGNTMREVLVARGGAVSAASGLGLAERNGLEDHCCGRLG